MKRIVLVVASVLLVGGAPGCQSMGDRGGLADVPRVAGELVEQHCEGLRKNDRAALERLWADELRFVNLRGQVLTKNQRLENLRSGKTEFKALACNEVTTASWGKDWAVTICRAIIEGNYSGQEGSGDYRCMFVWAKPRGRWQLVGLQMTRIGG